MPTYFPLAQGVAPPKSRNEFVNFGIPGSREEENRHHVCGYGCEEGLDEELPPCIVKSKVTPTLKFCLHPVL